MLSDFHFKFNLIGFSCPLEKPPSGRFSTIRTAVDLVDPGRSLQAQKKYVAHDPIVWSDISFDVEIRGSYHAFLKVGIMFRPDRPFVTIVTPHAGSGCHHGVLLWGVDRRFWAAASTRPHCGFGRFYVTPGHELWSSGHCSGWSRERGIGGFRRTYLPTKGTG